jgi:hypothetical protein
MAFRVGASLFAVDKNLAAFARSTYGAGMGWVGMGQTRLDRKNNNNNSYLLEKGDVDTTQDAWR